MSSIRPVIASTIACLLLASPASAEDAFAGKTATLKFVEGVIVKGNVNSHSRVSTDLVSGVFMAVGKPLVTDLLDRYFSVVPAASAAPSALSTSATPSTASTVSIVTIPQDATAPTMTTSPNGAVTITLPAGAKQPSGTGASSQSIAQEIRDAEKQQDQLYVADPAPIGLGFSIDSFWVGAGEVNNRFEADMKVEWDFTRDDLNKINAALKLNQLAGTSTSVGIVKISTERTRFLRQAGARFDIGIDLKWKNQWKNNVVNVNVTDVAVEIDDSTTVNLGAKKHDYSDSVNVSDIPGVVMGLVEKVSEKLATKAGSTAAKEAGDSLAEQIFDNLEIGVLETNTTYDRSLDIVFGVDAKDITGKELRLTIVGGSASFDKEGDGHSIAVRLPAGCLPLQSVTLKVLSATYHYKELQNIELGISASHIPVELRTGIMTEDIGKMYEKTHAAAARDEDKPWMTVTADPLVYIPFHGIVVTGDPASGLPGVTVELAYDGKVRATTLTGPDGKFWDDQYVGVPSGTKPESAVLVRKDGYPNKNIVFIDDTAGYRITMYKNSADYIRVSGRVTDAAGNGIEGVEVHVMSDADVYAATDNRGAYTFSRILKTGKITVSAFKSGLSFQPVEKAVRAAETAVTVDLTPAAEMPLGTFIMDLKKVGTAALPKAISVQKGGKEFSAIVGGDATVRLPIVSPREQFTISAEGFILTPSSLQAQMGSGQYNQENRTDVTAMPLYAQSVVLSVEPSGRTTIEAGGVQAHDERPAENLTLAALAKDASGHPLANVPIRFEAAPVGGKAAVKFSQEGLRPGCGYATTDGSGLARVGIQAFSVLGPTTVYAVATDKYIATGVDSDQRQSNALAISVVASTRVTQAVSPTAGVIAYTNSKAVDGRAVPTVEKGGEMVFHLSGTLGNGAGARFTGYRLGYGKDGAAAPDTVTNGAIPPTVRKTFNDAGVYTAVFQVRERYGEQDLWSEKAHADFEVVQFTPPQATLTAPASGTVGQQVDMSIQASVTGSFKRLLLTFGDNAGMDVDLDAGLLAGRQSWSGSPYHTYAAPGAYVVTLKVTDGNDRVTEVRKNVTVAAAPADTAAPTGALTINGGQGSTTSRDVVVRVTGSDGSGSGITSYRLSNAGGSWCAWRPVDISSNAPKPTVDLQSAWQISGSAGSKTVLLQLKDAAGNISPSFSGTISYADAPAQGGTSGNAAPGFYPGANEPMYNWDHTAPTGAISVSSVSGGTADLHLTMNDGGTAPGNRMSFSANGSSWTNWEDFTGTKALSVQPGQTKVYVKYADGCGNVSNEYSANLPTVPPPPPQQSPSGTSPGAEQDPGAAAGTTAGTAKAAKRKPARPSAQPAGDNAKELAREEMKKAAEEKKKLAAEEKKKAANEKKRLAEEKKALAADMKKEPEAEKGGDLDLVVEDIVVPAEIFVGAKAPVEVVVVNGLKTAAKNITISCETDDGFKEKKTMSVGPGTTIRMKKFWIPKRAGSQSVRGSVEAAGDVNPGNNTMTKAVLVKELPADAPAGTGTGRPVKKPAKPMKPKAQ